MYFLQIENQPRRQTSWQAAARWFDSGDSEVPAPAAGQRKSAMHCPGHRSDFKVSPVTPGNALPTAFKKLLKTTYTYNDYITFYRLAERHPGHSSKSSALTEPVSTSHV